MQLAQLARDNFGDLGKAARALPTGAARFIQPTIDAWVHSLRPLKAVEPALNGSEAGKVKRAFIPNAAKLRPDMDDGKADVWASTVVAALSDLPVRCIVKACDRVIHRVYEFPSQLEADIRKEAEEERGRQNDYIRFLRQLHDYIHGTTKQLPDMRPADPLTEDEVRALVRGGIMSKSLLRMGVSIGSIRQDMLDRILAEEGQTTDA